MVSITPPKDLSKRKIATPAVRPNPNRPVQPAVPLRTTSDPPPRIKSAALALTVPYDEHVHVVDQLPRVPRNLIHAGAKPRVFIFAADDIRDATLVMCPRSGLVLPPKDCVPPLEEPAAVDDIEAKNAPRKRRKVVKVVLADENADDDKHIPRSPNAFILWRSEVFARIRSLNLAPADKGRLTAQVSEQWKSSISDAVKEHYQYLADIAKELHAQQHPDYKYCPKSAAEKAALKAIKDAKKKELREKTRELREAEKLAKKSKGASASTVEPPKRPTPTEHRYKGYPSTAWGSEGPPQGWTPEDGLAGLPDDDGDIDVDEPSETPVASRPPSPPPKQRRRPQQVLPSRSTFDFTLPPNPWPTFDQPVAWSDAAPPRPPTAYSGNAPNWAAAGSSSSSRHEYRGWSVQSAGQYHHPEIVVSLPASVVNEGLGLEGADSGLQSVLTTLEIAQAPSSYAHHHQAVPSSYALPHTVGFSGHTAAPAYAPSAAPSLHTPPAAPLDAEYIRMTPAPSALDSFFNNALAYGGGGVGEMERPPQQQQQQGSVGSNEVAEGFWPDLLNLDFGNQGDFLEALTPVKTTFGTSSLLPQSESAPTPHGLGIDIMMDDEEDDGNQLSWEMAGQLIRSGWAQPSKSSNSSSSTFPCNTNTNSNNNVFAAQGQMNFSSPTDTTSYLSPASVGPAGGGLDSAEHSPPPYYEPPLEGEVRGVLDPAVLQGGVGRAVGFGKQYVPSPLGGGGGGKSVGDVVAVGDRPPEIPRASKPKLKHLPGAGVGVGGGGRRVPSIATTLPPIPNLTSSH